MRLRSNHSIGLELASAFTLVGLTRVSIGPAIKVMLRGCAAAAPGNVATTVMSNERREAELKRRLVTAGSIMVFALITFSFDFAAEKPATPCRHLGALWTSR